MGLRRDFDTIIVIHKTDIEKVVDIVHQILLERNFAVEDDEYLSFFLLNEIIDDEHLDEDYDLIRSVVNVQETLDILKNHKGGGGLMYKKNMSNVIVNFKSLNDKEIEAIIFEADEYLGETDDFHNIITDINKSELEIIGITQGFRMLNDLDQETEIQKILDGRINENYKYIID